MAIHSQVMIAFAIVAGLPILAAFSLHAWTVFQAWLGERRLMESIQQLSQAAEYERRIRGSGRHYATVAVVQPSHLRSSAGLRAGRYANMKLQRERVRRAYNSYAPLPTRTCPGYGYNVIG